MDVGRDWQSNSGIDQVSEVMADVSEVVMMAWSWLMLRATCASSGNVQGPGTGAAGRWCELVTRLNRLYCTATGLGVTGPWRRGRKRGGGDGIAVRSGEGICREGVTEGCYLEWASGGVLLSRTRLRDIGGGEVAEADLVDRLSARM